MKKRTFLRLGGVILTCMVLSGFLNACTDHLDPQPVAPADRIATSKFLTMPDAFALPPNPQGYDRVATYYAVGVQKYKAQLKEGASPAQYEWVFVAPEADLYDTTNVKIGTHFAGPTWKITSTSHTIAGQAFSPAKTFSKDPASIDWLLLKSKVGQEPTGIFAGVSYIFRIATTGGRAPATAPTSINDTADVPYTAVYRFVRPLL